MHRVGEAIRDHFRSRRDALLAAARESICDHPGLTGSHREAVIRQYLARIVPKRFGIGRGMVYGAHHRSREADVVLWDELSYPRLDLSDHTFFFAESVRLVIETKSRYSADEFDDVLAKCRAVKDIVPHIAEFGFGERLQMIEDRVTALATGNTFDGALIFPHHIGTAGLMLMGGSSVDLRQLLVGRKDDIDDEWPDALLFLEAGKVAAKRYPDDGAAFVEICDAGEDALLLFTLELLSIVGERSAAVENQFYIHDYLWPVLDKLSSYRVSFPQSRPSARRLGFWRRPK